jgi:hypothetical protein
MQAGAVFEELGKRKANNGGAATKLKAKAEQARAPAQAQKGPGRDCRATPIAPLRSFFPPLCRCPLVLPVLNNTSGPRRPLATSQPPAEWAGEGRVTKPLPTARSY